MQLTLRRTIFCDYNDKIFQYNFLPNAINCRQDKILFFLLFCFLFYFVMLCYVMLYILCYVMLTLRWPCNTLILTVFVWRWTDILPLTYTFCVREIFNFFGEKKNAGELTRTTPLLCNSTRPQHTLQKQFQFKQFTL